MPILVECRECHRQLQAERINKLWCDECAKQRRRAYHSQYDKYTRRKPCPQCGIPIGLRASLCRPCENKARATRYLGANNPNWHEGRMADSKTGYVHLRVSATAKGSKAYRLEHHIVWERTHGKPLPKGWVVHHLNGVKDDNRPENLAAMSRAEHHRHPRQALRPYEARIKQLEEEVRALWLGKRLGTEPCDYPYCETPCERPCDESHLATDL